MALEAREIVEVQHVNRLPVLRSTINLTVPLGERGAFVERIGLAVEQDERTVMAEPAELVRASQPRRPAPRTTMRGASCATAGGVSSSARPTSTSPSSTRQA